jgi:hypothetical protein
VTPEDRIRQALNARASSVEPSPDGLDKIQERLMESERSTLNRNRMLIGLGSAAAVLLIVLAIVIFTKDDNKVATVTSSSTSSTEPTTTSTSTTATTGTSVPPPTSTTNPAPGKLDASVPLYPVPSNGLRYDDPKQAATDFAQEILGFSRLVVGSFQQGDSRSGEVQVRRTSTGSVTTILLRKLEDDHWWVIGANTDNIVLTSPANRATVTSPVHLTGKSIAFEAVVNVSIYADAAKKLVVGEGTVMGGGTEVQPFAGDVAYDLMGSGAKYGVVVLYTQSAEDGTVVEATAIRVRFR